MGGLLGCEQLRLHVLAVHHAWRSHAWGFLLQSDIQNNMFVASPSNKDGLVIAYNFAATEVSNAGGAPGDYGKVGLTC